MKNRKKIILLIFLMVLFITGCSFKEQKINTQSVKENSVKYEEKLIVHFIDVGQADSILIKSDDSFMLIDAGNNEDSQLIKSYLKEQGVKRLEYVIGTHPHEDHIGALDTIIEEFEVGTILLPKVAHSSQTFENVLNAISEKGLKITNPVVRNTYEIGAAKFILLGPNSDYGDNFNDWSIGIKLVYGNNSFVLCGDAEQQAESDIVKTGIDIRADVLKIGHHGSDTSTSDIFLKAVNPSFAIISCGRNNTYGAPDGETLQKLKNLGISFFRTDLQGTIIASTDGTTITWNTEPSNNYSDGYATSLQKQNVSENEEVSNEEATKEETAATSTYVLNTNTKKFHYQSCDSVDKIAEMNRESSNASREELIKKGFEPCGNCKP